MGGQVSNDSVLPQRCGWSIVLIESPIGIVDVEIELDSGSSSEDEATAEENTYSYDEKSEEKSEKKSSDISNNETFHLDG